MSDRARRRETPPALDLDVDRFLAESWQRAPALLRGALSGYRCPLSPEDVAGLACEPDVESRLVFEHGAEPWRVEHGPFDAATFAALPEAGWSLLVHGVDRIVPEIAAVLDAFRFLPNWRFDDVMISVAPAGGSVGAHVDDYDVFLVQGAGRRRWTWTEAPVDDPRFVDGLDLRLLRSYAPDREAVVEPGDVLYLPPRVGHHGVAVDRCTTLSVGFRAPSAADLLAGWLEAAAGEADPPRFADPGRVRPDHPGEIPDDALDEARRLLTDGLDDRAALARWFGATVTTPRRMPPEPPERPVDPAAVRRHLAAGGRLIRTAPALLAFSRAPEGGVVLFHGGECTDLPPGLAPFVERLTGRGPLDRSTLAAYSDDGRATATLAALASAGLLELA